MCRRRGGRKSVFFGDAEYVWNKIIKCPDKNDPFSIIKVKVYQVPLMTVLPRLFPEFYTLLKDLDLELKIEQRIRSNNLTYLIIRIRKNEETIVTYTILPTAKGVVIVEDTKVNTYEAFMNMLKEVKSVKVSGDKTLEDLITCVREDCCPPTVKEWCERELKRILIL